MEVSTQNIMYGHMKWGGGPYPPLTSPPLALPHDMFTTCSVVHDKFLVVATQNIMYGHMIWEGLPPSPSLPSSQHVHDMFMTCL